MAIDILNIGWCFDIDKANEELEAAMPSVKANTASHADKLVLLLMADCANGEDADGIFPSNVYIAQNCCLSTRTVQHAKRRLEVLGIISQVKEANSKKSRDSQRKYRRAPEYKINIDRLSFFLNETIAKKRRVSSLPSTGEPDSPVRIERVKEIHRYGRNGCTGTGESSSPNPLIEPSNKNLFTSIFFPLPKKGDIPVAISDAKNDVTAEKWAYVFDVIKLREAEFENLINLTDMDFEQFYDFLQQQDDYYVKNGLEAHEDGWRRMLLNFITRYHHKDMKHAG